jgi:hypothetical protein
MELLDERGYSSNTIDLKPELLWKGRLNVKISSFCSVLVKEDWLIIVSCMIHREKYLGGGATRNLPAGVETTVGLDATREPHAQTPAMFLFAYLRNL